MVDLAGPAKNARKSDLPLDARLSRLLIGEIIANRFPPGSWLREQEIAARYEVSRASVREALRNVAYAGFVEIEPWRGARVAQVTRSELLDIFSLLEQTYGKCAYWAAERYPATAFARLDAMIQAMEAAVRDRAPRDDQDTMAFALGQLVGRNSGSRLAYRMLVQVGNLALWQQRVLHPGTEHTAEQSVAAHRVMISAIQAREPEIAEAAARMIVMITRRTLETGVAAESPAPAPARKPRRTARPATKSEIV